MCIRLDKIFNFLHFPQFILCQDATITGAGTSDVTLARDSLSGWDNTLLQQEQADIAFGLNCTSRTIPRWTMSADSNVLKEDHVLSQPQDLCYDV